MRFLLLALVLVLVIVIIRCDADDSSQEYSAAEAIAAVKVDLIDSAECMMLRQTGQYNENLVRIAAHYLSMGEWSANHQSDNIWNVYCYGQLPRYTDEGWSLETGTAIWNVYETSGLVELLQH